MKSAIYIPQSTRLLEQLREVFRYRHYSLKTEQAYHYWVRFFVRWCGRNGRLRHPRDMGAPEVTQFLTMLANERRVSAPLCAMDGQTALLAKLLYGTGMRLMEGLRLRIKDVDMDRQVLMVRQAKGGKDRVVMLPRTLHDALLAQIAHARIERRHHLHEDCTQRAIKLDALSAMA